MTITCKGWDRKFWGVQFRSGQKRDRPMMLGALWDDEEMTTKHRAAEPSRPLLFRTRVQARAWCARQRAKYADRSDSLRHWQFKLVRVRERVEIVES